MKFLHEYIEHPNGKIDNGYWEIDGNILRNYYGGWHIYRPKEDDEIIESTWEEMEYRNVLSRLDPDSITGWLAPDGTFYGCDSYDHAMVAEIVLKSDEDELQDRGYCRIQSNPLRYLPDRPEYLLHYNKVLTEAQIDVLAQKGFDMY